MLVGLAVPTVMLLILHGAARFRKVPVIVMVPKSPPPRLISDSDANSSATNNTSSWDEVPYEQAVVKWITPQDIAAIRKRCTSGRLIPRVPAEIWVSSDTEASVMYPQRGLMQSLATLEKQDGSWRITREWESQVDCGLGLTKMGRIRHFLGF